jgi:hypothetical protein
MERLGLYGAGLFVAHNINGGGSEGGGGSESGVGTTWTLRMMGFRALYCVTYGNGTFVAVGDRGAIFTSPDGVTWTRRTSPTDDWLSGVNWLGGVTYGNGIFVAVGRDVGSYSDYGTILTSP